MASIKTKFNVGLFVMLGVFIAVIAIMWLGISHYFEKGKLYAAYFDESVQGLNKDSPVKYRGVTIGRVDSIGVAPDATLIEVVMKIETDLKPGNNLVAQLKSVGITGIMFVELDNKKDDEKDYSPEINFPSKYLVIATKPSDIKLYMEGFSKILQEINSLDLNASLKKWDSALIAVEKAGNSFNELSQNADNTISNLQVHLLTTMQNFERASTHLNETVERISDQPSRLIFSEPPPSKKIGD